MLKFKDQTLIQKNTCEKATKIPMFMCEKDLEKTLSIDIITNYIIQIKAIV